MDIQIKQEVFETHDGTIIKEEPGFKPGDAEQVVVVKVEAEEIHPQIPLKRYLLF